PRVRTELFQLLVIPPLAPHPEQPHRQLACHSYFGNRMIAAQRQVRVLVSPLLLRTSHALRRLPQQEPKQRIALLTDVAQPPAVRAVLAGAEWSREATATPPVRPSLPSPQPSLAPYAFVHGDRLQLIHYSRPHSHQAMPVQHQLPYIPILRSWHPDAGGVEEK